VANSIQAAPAVLADGVIASLRNKLPMLNSMSRVFTSTPQASGKTIQVPLIGASSATEFGASGYLSQDDATVTKADVTLKHFKVSTRVDPLNLKEYGASFFIDNFTVTAANALAQKCMDEIRAIITVSNYSQDVVSGAALSYAEVLSAKKTLDDGQAPEPRVLVLNNKYTQDLLGDSTIVAANSFGAQVIQSGRVGTLAGAEVFQFSNLTTTEDLGGFMASADAIAVAAALPYTEIPGWEVANAIDPMTGLGVQVIIGQEQSGFMNVTATLLFGAAKGRGTSLVRFETTVGG
jgi:hypothetical protein